MALLNKVFKTAQAIVISATTDDESTELFRVESATGTSLFSVGTSIAATLGIKVPKGTITYGTPMTPNFLLGQWFLVTVTNGTAMTFNAPTNPPSATQTSTLTIELLNSSGGAMGAITWNAAYTLTGGAFSGPTNGGRKFIQFQWNGTNWIEVARSANQY
jgi:hypothetical protein